jgi:uncharacterized membrane protein YhaH (DUF805 family)
MRVDFIPVDGVASQIFLVANTQSRFGEANPGLGRPVVGGAGVSIDWRKLFFDANGRIGQKDYWIGFGILFAANLVLSWMPLIGLVVSLVAAYAGVCVSSKRLHDMGRSGWLAAIPFGSLLVATALSGASLVGMIGAASADNGLGMAAGLGSFGLIWSLATLINIGFVIWLGVTAGQTDDNLYGPPPVPLVTT